MRQPVVFPWAGTGGWLQEANSNLGHKTPHVCCADRAWATSRCCVLFSATAPQPSGFVVLVAPSSCCQGLAGDTNHFQAGLLSCRCDAGLQGTLNMIAQPLPTQNVKVCAPAAWTWGECPSSPQISCSKAEGRCRMAGLTPQHGYKISRDDFGGAELCRAPCQLLLLLWGVSPLQPWVLVCPKNSPSVRWEFLPNWPSPTPGKIPALPQLCPQFC